jgi:tetratricopeptide (TPR) repeat protein
VEVTPAVKDSLPSSRMAPLSGLGFWRNLKHTVRRLTGPLAVIGILSLLIAGTVVIVRPSLLSRRQGPDEAGAAAHWQEAQEAIANRDFGTAIVHLDQCLESWPFNAEAHFLQARTCRRAGNFTAWKYHLDQAVILLWPKEQIALERQLRRAQSGDVWTVENTLIDQLNNQPPEEVLILEALVKGFQENDRLDDVHFFTTTWIKRFPGDWLPRILRGNATIQLYGKTSEIVRDYEYVLELKPDQPEAHLSLASVLLNNGQYAEALSHFEAYLQSEPEDPAGALFGVAKCQFSLSQTREAQAALDQLFARHPDHSEACLLRGKIELAKGNPEEALKWLAKAESLIPSDLDVTNSLLQVYRQLDRSKMVEKYQPLVEEIRKRDVELDGLIRQIQIESDNIDLRFKAAMITLKLGRNRDASHWFQSILRKDPNHQPTLNALADYYKEIGDPKGAEYYRSRAQGMKNAGTADPSKQEPSPTAPPNK